MANYRSFKKLSSDAPFWEKGLNPITMRREESYSAVEEETIKPRKYDPITKARI